MPLLHGQWRTVALEVIEQVAVARDRNEALGGLFATLRRHVDFDCGSAVSLEGAEFFSFQKPELCRRAWAENAARYLEEGRPALDAGLTQRGVIRDCDVLSARERDRRTFYDEYMRPLRAKSFAMLLVAHGSEITQILSLSRAGASSFSAAELDALRLLRPALSVAARVFTGAPESAIGRGVPDCPLTLREAEIVGYLVRGLQNPEIAACLGTSKHTVRNQVQRVFRKLDVSTRAELVAVVLANGWAAGLDRAL